MGGLRLTCLGPTLGAELDFEFSLEGSIVAPRSTELRRGEGVSDRLAEETDAAEPCEPPCILPGCLLWPVPC